MAQEKASISIARQPGILYLPSQMLETRKLIEKQAAKEGLDGVAVEWRTRRC
jgi:NitT/TauT family transport system substrate-binding protein